MKNVLFAGKRKFFTIPLILGFVAYFWPFLLAAILIYLVFKNVQSNKARFITTALIVLFSLPIGTGWILGMSGHIPDTKVLPQDVAGEHTVANTPTPSPTIEPTSTPSATLTPTKKITPTKSLPNPTKYIVPTTAATNIPTQTVTQPTQAPVQQSGGYNCNCSKTCEEISSCAEAQYQLNVCGCSVRDRDNDGIACDSAPLHCQN